jgi:hypothetical protein
MRTRLPRSPLGGKGQLGLSFEDVVRWFRRTTPATSGQAAVLALHEAMRAHVRREVVPAFGGTGGGRRRRRGREEPPSAVLAAGTGSDPAFGGVGTQQGRRDQQPLAEPAGSAQKKGPAFGGAGGRHKPPSAAPRPLRPLAVDNPPMRRVWWARRPPLGCRDGHRYAVAGVVGATATATRWLSQPNPRGWRWARGGLAAVPAARAA